MSFENRSCIARLLMTSLPSPCRSIFASHQLHTSAMDESTEDEYITWSTHVDLVNETKSMFQCVLMHQLERFLNSVRNSRTVRSPEAAETEACDNASSSKSPTAAPEKRESLSTRTSQPRHSVRDSTEKSLAQQSPSTRRRTRVALQPSASSENLMSRRARETESKLRVEINQLSAELDSLKRQHEAILSTNLTSRQSDSTKSNPKESGKPQQSSSFASRRATLAAFRKASIASFARDSGVDSKAGADKAPPTLSQGNADTYFSTEKREKTIEELEQLMLIPHTGHLPEKLSTDSIGAIRVAATNENKLFSETLETLRQIQEQDRFDIEQAILRQTLKLNAAKAQVSTLITHELTKVSSGNNDQSKRQESPEMNVESDADSSDSDVLQTNRDVELTRMHDGSIRVSVGLQTELVGPNDLNLAVFDSSLAQVALREKKMSESMDQMNMLLRQLERCNDAFESEIFCLSCKQSMVELHCMWPCGHHYCLDCLYSTENEGVNGYFCGECHTITTDIPVPNVPVNDLIARMAFKRSGVHELFDVISRYRKETTLLEIQTRTLLGGLYHCTSSGLTELNDNV